LLSISMFVIYLYVCYLSLCLLSISMFVIYLYVCYLSLCLSSLCLSLTLMGVGGSMHFGDVVCDSGFLSDCV